MHHYKVYLENGDKIPLSTDKPLHTAEDAKTLLEAMYAGFTERVGVVIDIKPTTLLWCASQRTKKLAAER